MQLHENYILHIWLNYGQFFFIVTVVEVTIFSQYLYCTATFKKIFLIA